METLKKEERTTCLVPSKMLPSKQTFMDLGFTFKVIPNSDLCLATLPEGWISVAGEDFWINLIDEKGRERGSYIYEPHCNNFMELSKRFYISHGIVPDSSRSVYIFIRDRANARLVFSVGSCNLGDSYKINILNLKAKNFLNKHYPDWEDPTKYWDLPESTIEYNWCNVNF